MKTIQANAIVSSFAGMCTIMIVFIGFLGIVSSKVFAQSKEDNNFSGTPFVQLSEEDGLEPFDSKKIAGLILAGVIGEKDFFNLYTEQGVSEEQLVAVLKQVYAQQGFRVDEGEVEGIVHVKLFSGLGIEKEKKPNTLTRAMQTSACENYDVSNWKEPKKNVKRGPDFPYHVVRLANTQVCGPDNDYVLDYNLHDDYAKKKSKIRVWHKDWWVRQKFSTYIPGISTGKIATNFCQKPAKACLGAGRLGNDSGKAWDLQLWLEK